MDRLKTTASLVMLWLCSSAASFAAQGWRGKQVFFGDAHWHSCLSQDATRTLTQQYESMLNDYGLDFGLQSDHAEAVTAGICACDTYLPYRRAGGTCLPYSGEEIANAMKRAADDWNGRQRPCDTCSNGSITFVTFPGYEWAPDSRCWSDPLGPDNNSDNNTPGHINYFFSNTTGWSYSRDVWEPGDGPSDLCAIGTSTGIKGYYNGSRDWMDEILGQLIHQRDDPDRDYDLMIQYNHPAATLDKGGSTDHVAKWFDLEHSDTPCSVAPGGTPCGQSQCEAVRRAYGVGSVEWYASHEAALGSTEVHGSGGGLGEWYHHAYHVPGRYVASRGLKEGFNLASFGGSDDHKGAKTHPEGFPDGGRGAGSASLTAVYASEATRSAIWDGLSHKRTYTLSRLRGIGPVHKGRVDFFSPDAIVAEKFSISSFQGGFTAPQPEIGMGEMIGAPPEGTLRDFTVAAAAESGSTGVYPVELRLYRVGPDTPLSEQTDVSVHWLHDLGEPGKLGELLGRAFNGGCPSEFSCSNDPGSPQFTYTFRDIWIRPGDAVFAVVRYSDDVWVDDYYDEYGRKLADADGDGQYDVAPARHFNNNTWARTTPIWVYAANETARQSAFCSHVTFEGSPYRSDSAAGEADAEMPGDTEILPVGDRANKWNVESWGYNLEWNQWMVYVPADYKYVDLSFFNQKLDPLGPGHLFAVRVDGQLLFSGRAGTLFPAGLLTMKSIPFPIRKGLHKVEVHMDDQEYTESDDDYHCNDYDGLPGYVDAIVFHNGAGWACDDLTPPAITCPADITVDRSTTGGGVPASDPAIAQFLAGASATDAVDANPVISNNAPQLFPIGTTQVTFTATDFRGNAASCAATVTVPDFSVSCSPSTLNVFYPGTGSTTCTVGTVSASPGPVSLTCDGLPTASSCNAATVTPPANGSVDVVMTVSATPSTAFGTYAFRVRGTSRDENSGLDVVHSSSDLTLKVGNPNPKPPVPPVSGPIAEWDWEFEAPSCAAYGPVSSCDSSSTAIHRGRFEPNTPNTLGSACEDGWTGGNGVDRIRVRTFDGSSFAAGALVRLDAVVSASIRPLTEAVDVFVAPDASSPVWQRVATMVPQWAGQQTITATFALPAGDRHAVRVQFRKSADGGECTTGAYNDRDDLVFGVGTP